MSCSNSLVPESTLPRTNSFLSNSSYTPPQLPETGQVQHIYGLVIQEPSFYLSPVSIPRYTVSLSPISVLSPNYHVQTLEKQVQTLQQQALPQNEASTQDVSESAGKIAAQEQLDRLKNSNMELLQLLKSQIQVEDEKMHLIVRHTQRIEDEVSQNQKLQERVEALTQQTSQYKGQIEALKLQIEEQEKEKGEYMDANQQLSARYLKDQETIKDLQKQLDELNIKSETK